MPSNGLRADEALLLFVPTQATTPTFGLMTRSEIRWIKIPLGSKVARRSRQGPALRARRRRRVAGRRGASLSWTFCGRSRDPAMALACLSISCGRTSFTASCSARLRTWSPASRSWSLPRDRSPRYRSTSCSSAILRPNCAWSRSNMPRRIGWHGTPQSVCCPRSRALAPCADFASNPSQLSLHGFRQPTVIWTGRRRSPGLGEAELPGRIQQRCRSQPTRDRAPAVGSPPRACSPMSLSFATRSPFPKQQTSSAWLRNYWVRRRTSVYLGERATERVLKALSADGELKRARVLHFATHGLLPGRRKALRNRAPSRR